MAKQDRWERREKKQQSKRDRMPKHGHSVFTIQEVLVKRGTEARKERENG